MRKEILSPCFEMSTCQWCTTFFTRSSAIISPVNMKLCQDLGLNLTSLSPSSSFNHQHGWRCCYHKYRARNISTFTRNLGRLWTAFVLSVVAAISACGASGIAGGSLFAIPVACGLFWDFQRRLCRLSRSVCVIGVVPRLY